MAGTEVSNQTSIKPDSFGNRSLWQLINGTGVLRPKELVSRELTRNGKKILEGLSFYKKPVTIAGEQLKGKRLSKLHKDLVQKISQYLGLEELQSWELFSSFLSNDYRGSQKNLQQILSNERHTQALVYKIRDYYYTERLYLLQCVKVVINFWQDDDHPYKDELEQFMRRLTTDGDIMAKLLDQFKGCIKEQLPTWETNGTMMTERQAHVWAHQNLLEQCELLEILVIFLKDIEINTDQAINLVEMFKRHGFGRHQKYKHILEDPAEPFIKKIGHLEMLILLETLDLEMVHGCTHLGSFDGHCILKDPNSFKRLDEVIQTLGSDPSHGPLLLSWVAIRMVYPTATDNAITRKMGNSALALRVFDVLYEILNTEPFTSKTSFVSSVAHYVVYNMLVNLLSAFDEGSLGGEREIQVLYANICKLLKQEFVSEDFWNKGLEEGLGSVFHSSRLKFPLDFGSLVRFSTSLASSGIDSARKIVEVWRKLPCYTEFLDRNAVSDINQTKDPLIWQLARNKIPYPGGNHTTHSVIWLMLTQIIDETCFWTLVAYSNSILQLNIWENVIIKLLPYFVGMVSPMQVSRVTLIVEMVSAVLGAYPKAVEELDQIIECLYQLIHRFANFNPPPLDLMTACIQCLTSVAKKHPTKVWHNMKQTGMVPYLTENVDNLAEVLSGQGLSVGLYGAILAGYECNQGRYSVTVAFLDFISCFIKPFFAEERENDLMAPILYFLREVFPVFQKWRYYSSAKRETIGQKCLDIFHKILTFLTGNRKKKSNRPHLQEVCVYSLLFTEAGRSLLDLIAMGADTIEMALIQQGSFVEAGTGVEMIQLVQMSFSVLNRLLLLKSPDQPLSPVESALSSQPAGRQTQHIVATIAGYIYHKHNPRLPALACLLLKRLALVSRMSILACLGGDAETIRDMYLSRLYAVTEDLRLKVVILELLSVCVEAQPGLIEIFLNVQPAETASGTDASATRASKKDLSLGKTSCLQTVLDLMDAKKQGEYMCPPDLLCACMDFIHALWAGLRDTAMSVLRARTNFWLSVCAPLTRDLPSPGEEDEMQIAVPYQVRTIAFVLRILSEEIYTVTSAKLDSKLKKVLADVSDANRWKYWSGYVRDCVVSQAERTEPELPGDNLADHPTLQLLMAWKNFVITITKLKVDELKVNNSLKEVIMVDLMEGVQALVSGDLSVLNIKLAQIASAFLFNLIKQWTSSLSNQTRMIKELQAAVVHTLSNSKTLIPPIQVGLLGSVTAIIQHSRLNSVTDMSPDKYLSVVLPTTCAVLLQSTRQLPSPRDLVDKKDSQGELAAGNIRLKMQIVTCCLLEELILQCDRSEMWLPVLQEHFILPTLMASMEVFIKGKQAVHYVQTVFLLLLTIAKYDKGAEALTMSGVTQHTCLSMISLYQDSDLFSKPGAPARKDVTELQQNSRASWHGIYCICVDLYATVLSALKYSFLEDALHFVGAHQDRMQQCLELSRITLTPGALYEAEKTCDFIHKLSHFAREWRLHLPDSLIKLQTSMIYMSQSFIAFLMRPRYLQHILEQHSGQKGQTRERTSTSPKQPRLQAQSSMEDIDAPSSQLLHTQHRMLTILGMSFSSLRQFTPDLLEILYEQSVDYSEYEPFLAMGFSAPSVDQDSTPSFGTLTTCVRDVCVKFLTKLEPKSGSSPQRSTSPVNNINQVISKSLVLYVMENALYIIMSQATRYLRDPHLVSTDKQLLKRELGTEMNYFLKELERYLRKGTPVSPNTSSTTLSPRTAHSGGPLLGRSISQTSFAISQETEFFRFVREILATSTETLLLLLWSIQVPAIEILSSSLSIHSNTYNKD
ncbi:Nucleoporin NUP188-like protein [Mizuhopecten yessoensis]|uniref:Nucleoporin NUP188 n=1 Tax=Mizuhopecten yessoensis TaxID=6573 RepID=A0A210PSR1_MIZYE|nr:Nucleoporin NUP188-like protein [Mizuhopecten yessoensis]